MFRSFSDLADSFFGRKISLGGVVAIGLAATSLVVPASLAAPSTPSSTVIIDDDRGGPVEQRVALIKKYRTQGTPVEIRGKYCLSACTMYLGLSQICVLPTTIFGFHGPSSRFYGIALPEEAFQRWSRVMAAHYPEPIRSWFLVKGRHRIVGFYEYKGRQLIDMGIRQCPQKVTS